jgi:antitoxin (DNA-binding transcriptional repressor) of toxin-antitoxin stability system
MQTRSFDINQLPPTIADLLALIAGGDEIVIEEDGKAVARLSPVPTQSEQRIAGLHEGQGWVSEDFDEPLPDEFWAGRV